MRLILFYSFISISAFFVVLNDGNSSEVNLANTNQLECGVYEITGKLSINHHIDQLEVYPGTTNRFWITLKKMNPEDSFYYKQKVVKVRARVKELVDLAHLKAYVTEFKGLVPYSKLKEESIRLIHKKDCKALK